jgi:adenylate cyclase
MEDVKYVLVDEPAHLCRTPPSPEEVRTQLKRIVNSPEFSIPERGCAFLRYVVEETIEGRAGRIKAYSVAIEVFGRDEGFTQDDPVVRIEAGKLRRALERYYLLGGHNDSVRIDMPKGSYVPSFTWNVPEEATSLPLEREPSPALPNITRHPWWRSRLQAPIALIILTGVAGSAFWIVARHPIEPSWHTRQASIPETPTLQIAPIADLGEGPQAKTYALGLTEELLAQLPRFKDLTVFGPARSDSSSQQTVSPPPPAQTSARFVLAGGVRISGDRIRVTVRLLAAETATVLWSQIYDYDRSFGDALAIQSDVAGKVASAIARPYGAISQADTLYVAQQQPNELDAYSCTLSYYTYRIKFDVETQASAKQCLERVVASAPTYATAWAMLSIAYLDEDRVLSGSQTESQSLAERALSSARRAVELEPSNTRALQALMMALFFSRQLSESLRVGEQALALNPNDTELMGEFGARLALSGQWERGTTLLEEALERNPQGGGYYYTILALAAYIRGDYETALTDVRQANPQKFPFFHMVAAVIYAQNGMTADANREADLFVAMRPGSFRNLEAELEQRNLRPEDRARLLADFRTVGLPVARDATPASPSAGLFGGAAAQLEFAGHGADASTGDTPTLGHMSNP